MSTLDGTLEEIQTPENWKEEIDYEAKYKALQADYTKKAQRIKELETKETLDPDWEQLKARLDYNGYAKKEEIINIKESVIADQRLADLIAANPELKRQERAIKEMAELKWMAYEDVINEYWFGGWMDKLNKAKDRRLVWDRSIDEKPKTIADLTDAEFEALEKQFRWQWHFSQLESL